MGADDARGSPAAVEYADDEPNGLAAMIGGVLEGNLEHHPDRSSLLRPATIGIVSTDADSSITIRLGPGRVTVWNGLVGHRDVEVHTDSATLAELPSVPLRFGWPDATTAEGRAATRKILSGDLRVRGLINHPGVVSRLNRLLSVV